MLAMARAVLAHLAVRVTERALSASETAAGSGGSAAASIGESYRAPEPLEGRPGRVGAAPSLLE